MAPLLSVIATLYADSLADLNEISQRSKNQAIVGLYRGEAKQMVLN
jgi:hypothetical protein